MKGTSFFGESEKEIVYFKNAMSLQVLKKFMGYGVE